MKRNINLCLENIDEENSQYQNVSVYNIDKIVNNSCDIVTVSILEQLSPQECETTILKSLDKLKPIGYLVLSFVNFKKICYDYHIGKVNNKIMIENIQNKKCILDLNYIEKIISKNNYHIVNLTEQEYGFEISIKKDNL